MSHKPRGAPHGNRNAWKHGFYSAGFKENERRLLKDLPASDLTSEIDLIRIANLRFLEALSASHAPLDVNTQLAALRAVNLSAQSIASLVRAQLLTTAIVDTDGRADFIKALQATSPKGSGHGEGAQPDAAASTPDLPILDE